MICLLVVGCYQERNKTKQYVQKNQSVKLRKKNIRIHNNDECY